MFATGREKNLDENWITIVDLQGELEMKKWKHRKLFSKNVESRQGTEHKCDIRATKC